MKHAKQMATCAMMTAVCVVLMLLGGILEIGIYAAPMFAGLCLVPIGERWGRRTQLMVYLAVALLSFLLVPSLEENLIFATLLGWYPILRPSLQKLPRLLRLSVKLLLFNAVIIAVEALLLTLITPEGEKIPLMMLHEKQRDLSHKMIRTYTYQIPLSVHPKLNGLDLSRCSAVIISRKGQ